MSNCERDERYERIDALDKKINERTEWTDYYISGTNDIRKEIFEFGMELHVIQIKHLSREDFPMFVGRQDGLDPYFFENKWAIFVPAPINFVLSAFHDTEREALDRMTDYYQGTRLMTL